jgi:hypothetical protein
LGSISSAVAKNPAKFAASAALAEFGTLVAAPLVPGRSGGTGGFDEVHHRDHQTIQA